MFVNIIMITNLGWLEVAEATKRLNLGAFEVPHPKLKEASIKWHSIR